MAQLPQKPHITGGIFQGIPINSEWSQRNENLIFPAIAEIPPQSSIWQKSHSMRLVIFFPFFLKQYFCVFAWHSSPKAITLSKILVSPVYTSQFFTKCPQNTKMSIFFEVQQLSSSTSKKFQILKKNWVKVWNY